MGRDGSELLVSLITVEDNLASLPLLFFLTLAQAPVLWGWTQGYGVNRLDLYPTHPVALSHLTATANKFHVFLGDSIEAMGPITRRLSLTDSTITSFQLGENMPYKAD